MRKDTRLWLVICGLLLFVVLLACDPAQQGKKFSPVVYRDDNKIVSVQKVTADAEAGILVAGALTDGASPVNVRFSVNGKTERIRDADAATSGQLLGAMEANLPISGTDFDFFQAVETRRAVDVTVGDFVQVATLGLGNLGATVALGAALQRQLETGTPPVSPEQFAMLDVIDLPFLANRELRESLVTATPHAGGGAVTVTLRYDNRSSATLFDVFGIVTEPIGDAVLLNADEGAGGFTLTPEGARGTSDGEIVPGESFQMFLSFAVTGISDPAVDPNEAEREALRFARKLVRVVEVLAFDNDQLDQVISVEITSPLHNTTTSTAAVLVSGTAEGANEVDVNGIAAPVIGGIFGTTLTLSEGRSRIFATAASSTQPDVFTSDSVEVAVDTTPPRVTLSSPATNQLFTESSLNVAGYVLDAGEEVAVSIGTQETAAGQNGSFLIPAISLSPGPNTILVTATDRAGNSSTTTTAVFFDPNPSVDRVSVTGGNLQQAPVGTVLPQALEVRVSDATDSPLAGAPVTFEVVRGDSTFDGKPPAEVRRTIVPTDSQGFADVALALGATAGVHHVLASATTTPIVADFLFTVLPGPAEKLVVLLPRQSDAALTGETFTVEVAAVDRFGNRVPDVDVDLAVTLGGGSFGGSPTFATSTSAVGIASADYTVGDIAGVRNEITADLTGNVGLPLRFVFDPVTPGDAQQTSISGRLLDPLLNPLSGAIVSSATSTAATLTDGTFGLTGVSPGTVVLDIQAPGLLGSFELAGTSVRVDTRPGVENAVPWLIVPVEGADATLIGASDATLIDVNSQAEVLILANSVFLDGTATSTPATLSAVPNDHLPEALPGGESTVVTLLLSPNDLDFDPPAPVSVPNAEELPAGGTVRLYRFDNIGNFALDALGQISADGSTVETLPGMGITGSGLIALATSPQSPSMIAENPSPGGGAIVLDGTFVVSGANIQTGAGAAGDFEFIVPVFSSRQTGTTLLPRLRTAGALDVTGHTDFFELTPGSSITASDFFPTSVTGQPPLLLNATSTPASLSPGGSGQIDVTGIFVNGSTADLSLRADGTVYLSTNPVLANVSENGSVLVAPDALGQGVDVPKVLVVAVNDGRWAVSPIQIVPDNEPPVITSAVLDPATPATGETATYTLDGIDNIAIVTGQAQVTAATATTTLVVSSDTFTGAPPYISTFVVPLDALSLFISASVADGGGNQTATTTVASVVDNQAPVITQLEVVPDPAVAGQSASLTFDGTDNIAIVTGAAQVIAQTATSTVPVFTQTFTGPTPYGGSFGVPSDALSLFVSVSLSDAATNTTSTSAVISVEPAAGPPVAVGEFFATPPTQTKIYDISTNDTFDAQTASFVLVTAPPVPAELFTWNGDGTFSLTLPTFQFTAFLEYLISDVNGSSGTVSVSFSVDPSLLTTGLPVFLDGGVEKVSVPTLDIDGEHYPLYQLILAVGDACPISHYHRSVPVFSFEQPSAGISDPDPSGCGFGTFTLISGETLRTQVEVVVTKADWDAFLADPAHTSALSF